LRGRRRAVGNRPGAGGVELRLGLRLGLGLGLRLRLGLRLGLRSSRLSDSDQGTPHPGCIRVISHDSCENPSNLKSGLACEGRDRGGRPVLTRRAERRGTLLMNFNGSPHSFHTLSSPLAHSAKMSPNPATPPSKQPVFPPAALTTPPIHSHPQCNSFPANPCTPTPTPTPTCSSPQRGSAPFPSANTSVNSTSAAAILPE
jgi:hypothetical protein